MQIIQSQFIERRIGRDSRGLSFLRRFELVHELLEIVVALLGVEGHHNFSGAEFRGDGIIGVAIVGDIGCTRNCSTFAEIMRFERHRSRR